LPTLPAGFRVFGFVLLGLLGLEAGVRAALGEPPPPPATPTDRAGLDARLDAFFDAGPGGAVFLGDSVVRGGHLTDAGARLPARFAADTGARVLDLSVDGLLFSSLTCYVEAALAHAPDALVLDLSPRPLSADFGAFEPCVACEPAAPRPLRWLRGRSALLGRRNELQTRLFGDTPCTWALGALDARLRPPAPPTAPESAAPEPDAEDPEEAEIMARMAQVLKAAARLRTVAVDPARPQLAALDALLARLSAVSGRTRIVVFTLEENVEALSPQLDADAWRRVRGEFLARLSAGLASAPNVHRVDLAAADFAGHYVDHVHLDAEGYARAAARLAEAVK
jgi:hypothetical protein